MRLNGSPSASMSASAISWVRRRSSSALRAAVCCFSRIFGVMFLSKKSGASASSSGRGGKSEKSVELAGVRSPPCRSMASRIRRAAFSASAGGSNTSVAGVSVHFSTESRLRWLMQSNSRMESTSSSKNSMRRLWLHAGGYTSMMPPRRAHCPLPSTMLTRS